ncbi:Double-strand break repair protein MRE11A [Trichinella pseudospiralis]|uniref:Double-strand break repair protein MRE11A n=1 Tax=Trichinella pseudospiralis TaxID=6337 RepID=A0A0V1F8N3_TRIPS|nr:Double-strand break repair protein MRE11A [Trichinella pseudospiralis]
MPYGGLHGYRSHRRRDSLICDAVHDKQKRKEKVEVYRETLRELNAPKEFLENFNPELLEWLIKNDADVAEFSVIFSCENVFKVVSESEHVFQKFHITLKHLETRMNNAGLDVLIKFNSNRENLFAAMKILFQKKLLHSVRIYPPEDKSIPWFPSNLYELDNCKNVIMKINEKSEHQFEGWNDEEYRKRRLQFAKLAESYRHGCPIPYVEYTKEEVETWRTVFTSMGSLHKKYACKEYLNNFALLKEKAGFGPDAIPQLEDVSRFLQLHSGFRLRPVSGLVSARDFLACLALRVFPCTQYVRHHSFPHHTVEPDCIHELLGHVPMLLDPVIANFSQQIGMASLGVSDEDIEKIATLYWFSIEFGLCKENNEMKTFGAGLLSSYGELEHALSFKPQYQPFEPEVIALTKYQDEEYQPLYFVTESVEEALRKLENLKYKLKMTRESKISILVATDIHLGFEERSLIRGDDSFKTFEEVLSIAQRKKVDFILLGGDLFHDNKPSRSTVYRCMELIRKYCFCDHQVKFQLLSNGEVDFYHSAFKHANFQDSHLKVGIPIFTIYGNHDDVAGNGLCAVDCFHACGLVNLFGKHEGVEELNVVPLIVKKGSTKLALYGFGNVRDERLHRMFSKGKVTFPSEDPESCFNLFVIHQNRAQHSLSNYIPISFIPDMMDLVIWGHEHKPLPDPEWHEKFYIMQPGSTVATSLSDGEAGPKYCYLLHIAGKEFCSEKIELTTNRLFYFEDITLDNTGIPPDSADLEKKVEKYCVEHVESLLEKCKLTLEEEMDRPSLPLIRLRLHVNHEFKKFSVKQFGKQFVDRVANPMDLLIFATKRDSVAMLVTVDKKLLSAAVRKTSQDTCERIEAVMMVHTEKGMREAVKLYTDKGETNAIEMVVKNQLEKVQNRIKQLEPQDAGQVTEYLVDIREKRNAKKSTDAEVDADNLTESISNNITVESEWNNFVECDEVSRSTVVEENVLNNATENDKCSALADQIIDISSASNTDGSDAAETEIPTTRRGGRRQGRRASRKRSLCRSDEMVNETAEVTVNVSKRGRGRGGRNVRQGRAGQTANRKIHQRDLLIVPSSPVEGELTSEDTIMQKMDFDQQSNNVTEHQPTTSMTARSSQYKRFKIFDSDSE